MTRRNLKTFLLELLVSFLSTVYRRRLFSRKPSVWPSDSLRDLTGPKHRGNSPPSEGL